LARKDRRLTYRYNWEGVKTAMMEIRPGIWFVEGENRGRYPFAHSLYIEGEPNTLIDTGAGASLNEISSKTDQVVLSHYHRDHVTCNYLFKDAHFFIHKNDAPGVESAEGFYRLSGLNQVDVEAYWKMVNQINFEPTRINSYLADGDLIGSGKTIFRVLHLPGHTPGHCGFFFEEYGFIFAVDVDLTAFGPWYGNPSSDLEQFRASIKRLRNLQPELIATGHSLPTGQDIDQKLAAYEEILEKRDQKILKALKVRPHTLAELTDKKYIYRKHNGQEILRFFEKQMIAKHLKSLIKRGLVLKTEAGFYTGF
jgi:glyoxylase-like metal-dependent hydrolase (beta-lactamase superfamily II)